MKMYILQYYLCFDIQNYTAKTIVKFGKNLFGAWV